jgi:hypothetical protein
MTFLLYLEIANSLLTHFLYFYATFQIPNNKKILLHSQFKSQAKEVQGAKKRYPLDYNIRHGLAGLEDYVRET